MKIIDVHAHTFPRAYTTVIGKYLTEIPPIRENWCWDETRYLGEMDKWGVETQILSLAPPGLNFDNADMTRELSVLVNDTFSQICDKHPGRFRMFAAVSLIDPDHGIEELHRVKRAPGFVGIALTSNVLGKMLDDPLFASFFEVANSLKLTIFIHPVWRALPSEWNSFRLHHLIGLPVDTTFSISHLALSGFFDRYPDLHMILAHVGGTIPYLATRIERANREGKSQHKPSYYFKRLYYDTAGPTHEAVIACVARMLGSDQIVFGSDYPFGLGQEGKQYVENSLSLVRDSGLSAADQEKVFGKNVSRILP